MHLRVKKTFRKIIIISLSDEPCLSEFFTLRTERIYFKKLMLRFFKYFAVLNSSRFRISEFLIIIRVRQQIHCAASPQSSFSSAFRTLKSIQEITNFRNRTSLEEQTFFLQVCENYAGLFLTV